MNDRPEAISFRGHPLFAEDLRNGRDTAQLDANCEAAWAAVRQDDQTATRIKLAEELRAAGRYLEAVASLTTALNREPTNGDLLAERGHTYVNMREPELAHRDLEQAVKHAPRSFDAWYHLALARWFLTDFAGAAEAFLTAGEVVASDSNRLAAHVWHYTALARSGQHAAAAEFLPTIRWDVDLEGRNLNYQYRARYYQGLISAEELVDAQEAGTKSEGSLGFGLGILHLVRGETELARPHLESAANSTFWPAFGASAAELELVLLDGTALPEPELTGLLGDPLYSAVSHPPAESVEAEQNMRNAAAAAAAAPDDVDLIRAHAKTLASRLARYNEAQQVLEDGLERHPDHPMLLCDRGHYYVNMRRFDDALVNLQRARQQVADSEDIWYHEALAHWMLADFEAAHTAFQEALNHAQHDSQRAAYSDWLYMVLRRLGRDEEAARVLEPIHANMEMTGNNHLYLTRLLFYRGDITQAQAEERFSQGGLAFASYFGLGHWHLVNGDTELAADYFKRVVFGGTSWGGFAHVAAEAELARGLL